MDLHRNALRPTTELGGRDTGVEQQRPLRARPGLSQHLRRQHAEREPGIDEVIGQALGGDPTALEDGVEAHLLGVGDALVEGVERCAIVEIGNGDLMSGSTQLVGELADAIGEALGVMEQDDIGHGNSFFGIGQAALCERRSLTCGEVFGPLAGRTTWATSQLFP